MEYKGPDNIYWLFSSSAQSIAAFIGFLASGFFFAYQRIDSHIEKDETLEEIYGEIKSQYYTRLKILFILTGLSIVLSLAVVYFNGYKFGSFWQIIKIVIALLNFVTIAWAIFFVIYIIDPNKVKRVTKKLIEENKDVFQPEYGPTVSRAIFLDSFIELEKVVRRLAEKHEVLIGDQTRFRTFMTLGEVIRALFQREIINRLQYSDLLALNKIRNLAAHGEISIIESKQKEMVEQLTSDLTKLADP